MLQPVVVKLFQEECCKCFQYSSVNAFENQGVSAHFYELSTHKNTSCNSEQFGFYSYIIKAYIVC